MKILSESNGGSKRRGARAKAGSLTVEEPQSRDEGLNRSKGVSSWSSGKPAGLEWAL